MIFSLFDLVETRWYPVIEQMQYVLKNDDIAEFLFENRQTCNFFVLVKTSDISAYKPSPCVLIGYNDIRRLSSFGSINHRLKVSFQDNDIAMLFKLRFSHICPSV